MTVRFLEVAQGELDEAIAYYNSQVPGLGDACLLEAIAAIERIRRFPDAWQPLGEQVRRCRLRRFPYGLIYAVDESDILIRGGARAPPSRLLARSNHQARIDAPLLASARRP